MTVAVLAPVRVAPRPPSEPPLTYCPQHGGEMSFCGDWCLIARWAFFYASNDLAHYFKRIYRRVP